MSTSDNGVPIKAAAEALGVSEKTVRRRIKKGEIDAYSITTAQGFEWRVRLVVPDVDTSTVQPVPFGQRLVSDPRVADLSRRVDEMEARLAALGARAVPSPVALPREVIENAPSMRAQQVDAGVDDDAPEGVWARVRAWFGGGG